MKTVECVVCGIRLRHETVARDHRDAAHPEIKKSIPTRDLFRKVEDDE
ncbi:hypothetical protein SEA_LUCKYBARNES_49 [Brevibacterium phage LuckyBarnes]|uniref:C2H2-type domain-containing protein n=1 Tax=Brevibacterium phage LuckyBarnes TaxID=2027888 RepID=A0A249XNQ3_9CAUD|nr:hypothetical protein HOS02_gp49 [Brevibacterium phage LuckyBarnes]ASZ73366.1 hypothetical protein SEA_LUCKYBARNES_49 [Brevibacterium phage LuckyBarnes]